MIVRVLVVEDEPAIAENIGALLRAKGFEALHAGDGQAGLEIARKDRPELVLLDVILPRLGGFEVCRQLKADAQTSGIKVIMITALGRMGDVETAFQSGADDYLIKPFDSARLFKKIDKVLQAAK